MAKTETPKTSRIKETKTYTLEAQNIVEKVLLLEALKDKDVEVSGMVFSSSDKAALEKASDVLESDRLSVGDVLDLLETYKFEIVEKGSSKKAKKAEGEKRTRKANGTKEEIAARKVNEELRRKGKEALGLRSRGPIGEEGEAKLAAWMKAHGAKK